MNNKYYVYAYLRKDGTPYYIGKGCGRRAYQKSKRHKFVRMPDDKKRIIFIAENLTEEMAWQKEKENIKHYGRKIDGGILINIHEGGEFQGTNPGWHHTEESKEKMRGKRPNANIWNRGKKFPPKQQHCNYRGKEFDSIRDAAEYFDVTWKSVYKWIKAREKGVKLGRDNHHIPCVVKGIKFDMKKDAAEYFDVSLPTIYKWIKEGR
tara:strand:- start:8 stop:628 length:621 start_codon:yes stop_codon:yes gene_type:complete